MSNPSFPTIDEVIKKIMEDMQGEMIEQPENQETTHVEEVREEVKEVEGDSGGAKVFLTDKGAEIFKKTLAKKGFIGERGFKELVPPFKEEIERRGWDMICKHLEPSRRTLVIEFYANLGDRTAPYSYMRWSRAIRLIWEILLRSPSWNMQRGILLEISPTLP